MLKNTSLLIFVLIYVTACSPSTQPAALITELATGEATRRVTPEPVEMPLITDTPEPPMPTSTFIQTASSPAGADLPVVQPGDQISGKNAGQLRELANGEIADLQGVQYVHGLDKLALHLGDQMVLYDPQSAAGTEHWPLPASTLPWMHPGFLISPDGSLVAWLRGDCPHESLRCHIEVQPRAGGSPLLTLETDVLSAIAFSADNRFLVVGGSQGLEVFSLASGEQVVVLPESLYFDRIAISPDGSLLAGFVYMSEYVNVWRLPGGELAYHLQPQAYAGVFFPNHVVFSPDGQTLAAGANGLIGLWEAAGGKELSFWQPHNVEIGALAFSPDGKLLVSGDWDGNLTISNAETGTALHTLSGQTGMIWRAYFAAKGTLLVTFGGDSMMRLWGVLQD